MEQMSIFDGSTKFVSKKPIRLISLFSGYDSQALALKYLGVKFEHYKTCEWAVKSIQALKDLHFSNDNIDYSKNLTLNEVIKYLATKGISADYNEPMTQEQIEQLDEKQVRTIYNNIQATRNLVNIKQACGDDLEIKETNKYDYLVTYSFPCQDLSSAGRGKGMAKGSGTRSGMLWEVERLLDECCGYISHRHKPTNPKILSMTPYIDNYNPPDKTKLPQILLMENVPQVIGANNIKHFANWLAKLEILGYRNYKTILNAKDFGIPQNRRRCFMVSILGDFYFNFPQPIKLTTSLTDYLEDEVDEKFYLSEQMIDYIASDNAKWLGNNGKSIINRDVGVTINTRVGSTRCDCSDYICKDLPANFNLKDIELMQYPRGKNRGGILKTTDCPTITSSCFQNNTFIKLKTKNRRLKSMLDKIDLNQTQAIDMYNQSTHKEMHTIKTNIDTSNMSAITQNYRIRKLTPRECFRLMGVKDEDFDKVAKNQSNASLYHLAGDSIVVNVLMAIFKNLFLEDKQ